MADAAESRKIGMDYARVSSEEQRKGWSTDVQINSGLQLFAKLGVTVPDELIFNDGVSGDFPNRKGYQRLRQAVRERKGNFVYSQYSDRLARTWWQQGEFAAECYRHGVGLYIGNELVNDSRISKFMFGVRSVMDEDAKAILLERTRLGKEQRAKTGLPPGCTVPYGYDVVHHAPRRSEWLENERESQVVRQIYDMNGPLRTECLYLALQSGSLRPLLLSPPRQTSRKSLTPRRGPTARGPIPA
jgi:site-specific DNA recombinase